MDLIKTVIIAVLVFGFLIFIHEFGHYIFARIFKVTITEFSLGMGPKLLWYDSKKTGIRYCISAIPFGGYVAMVGEDGESDDPNAFNKKPAWQRLIVTVAGATVNIIAGVLAITIICSFSTLGNSTIAEFNKDVYTVSSHETGLNMGDEIVSIGGVEINSAEDLAGEIKSQGANPVDITVIRDGERIAVSGVVFPRGVANDGKVYGLVDFEVLGAGRIVGRFYKDIYSVSSNVSLKKGDKIVRIGSTFVSMADEVYYEIMRKGNEPVDITVIRDNTMMTIEDVVFPVIENQNQRVGLMDFKVEKIDNNPLNVLGYSFAKAVLIVRMCYESIIDLLVGRYTVEAVSGPVGISQAIGQAANQGIDSLFNIVALISINLGIMNLLPIPALDGGRIVLIFVEMIARKKLPASVEAKINAISLAVLLGLSAIIMIKDVVVLFI